MHDTRSSTKLYIPYSYTIDEVDPETCRWRPAILVAKEAGGLRMGLLAASGELAMNRR